MIIKKGNVLLSRNKNSERRFFMTSISNRELTEIYGGCAFGKLIYQNVRHAFCYWKIMNLMLRVFEF